MLLYIYSLKSKEVIHCLITNMNSLKESARNKKDVEHMFVDAAALFGLSRGCCIGKIYVPFRSSSQILICKCE